MMPAGDGKCPSPLLALKLLIKSLFLAILFLVKNITVEVTSLCKQTVCLHFELLYFLKYDVLSDYLTPFSFCYASKQIEARV